MKGKQFIELFLVEGCYDGCVYTLDAERGDIHWRYDTGGQVKCSPTVDQVTGRVYIGSHSHMVYCLDVKVLSLFSVHNQTVSQLGKMYVRH